MAFKPASICRICGHIAHLAWGGAAGPLFLDRCSVSGCESRDWHRHCGKEDKHGGSCTTIGCWPEGEDRTNPNVSTTQGSTTVTTTYNDPFASTGAPSVSFNNMPVGTSYTGTILELPAMVQARDFETGNPATWPDGNPKMTVVTKLSVNGEERSLWAPKPSAMFAAISDAQKAANAALAIGGTLTVTYVGDKPNATNPRLNPAKQYAATYQPPNAFAEETVTQTLDATPVTQPAQAPATGGPSPEQIAALKAAGVDPATVFPGYTG